MFYREYDLVISPFSAQLIHEVMCDQIKHIAGKALDQVFVVFENGRGKGYFSREEFKEVGDALVDKIVAGEIRPSQLKTQFDKEAQEMFEVCGQDPASIDEQQLASMLRRFCQSFKASYVPGVVPFLAAFSLEDHPSNLLRPSWV